MFRRSMPSGLTRGWNSVRQGEPLFADKGHAPNVESTALDWSLAEEEPLTRRLFVGEAGLRRSLPSGRALRGPGGSNPTCYWFLSFADRFEDNSEAIADLAKKYFGNCGDTQ
jgi:hypothetical protein